MFSFFNSIVINLSIIISTTLTLYFFSIKQSLKDNQFDTDFIAESGRVSLTKWHQVVLGFAFGLLSYFLTLNRIPLTDTISLDVRYLPSFFAVYYGSPLIGIVSGITLIVTKMIQYNIISAPTVEYINNIVLTTSLVTTACIVYQRKLAAKQAALTYLGIALIIRTITYFISYYKTTPDNDLWLLITYLLTFSAIFLFTAWFINQIVSLSTSIHVYRTSSIYDQLTRLYNKESFYFFMDHAYTDTLVNQQSFAIAIIDIDDFKKINDSFGHLVGDRFLKHFSSILKQNKTAPQNPRICRIGGDEFAIVFKHITPDPVRFLNESYKSFQNAPFIYDRHIIPINISTGLLFVHPSDNAVTHSSVEDIFAKADHLLYEVKRGKKGNFRILHTTL